MKKSIRERIDRARCNPANIREVRRQTAQRAWYANEETFRRAVAERDERRRRAKAGFTFPQGSSLAAGPVNGLPYEGQPFEPKDETTPYPHEPGYHLTVNGETITFVTYSGALTRFVEVLNGALETGIAVKMDLVGHGVTMGFLFERTTDPFGSEVASR